MGVVPVRNARSQRRRTFRTLSTTRLGPGCRRTAGTAQSVQHPQALRAGRDGRRGDWRCQQRVRSSSARDSNSHKCSASISQNVTGPTRLWCTYLSTTLGHGPLTASINSRGRFIPLCVIIARNTISVKNGKVFCQTCADPFTLYPRREDRYRRNVWSDGLRPHLYRGGRS